MNAQNYTNVVVALLLALALFNYSKAFLFSNTGLFLVRSCSIKPAKTTENIKQTLQQVSFDTPLKTASELQAKKEFDEIMAIPAYARKEMNINYPAYLA